MEKDPGASLYQPNLTCRYIPTKTPDNRMRVLTVMNNDPIGINDAQIATSLWSYVQNFRDRLRKQELPKEVLLPETSCFLTLNERHDVYSVVMVSEAKDIFLGDFEFLAILTQFCMSMANQLGVKLEGVNESRSESGTTPSGEAGL